MKNSKCYLSLLLWCSISLVFGQSNECINCTLYNGVCQMENTGWSVFKMSKRDKSLVAKIPQFTDESDYEIVFDENLINCVNDGYAITDTLETFVCFWSPLLGCQAVASKDVVNKHHMHYTVCKICARYCNCNVPSATWPAMELSLGQILRLIIGLTII